MAVTFFGESSNPADNSAHFDDAAVAVTEVASMLAADLCVCLASEATTTGAITVSETGGQTWNTLTSHEGGGTVQLVQRLFWCQFNGTWSASPSFLPAHTGDFQDFSVQMWAFRPTNNAATWAVDVAESAATYTAPAGPFDVTTTGQTAAAASGVFINIDTCFGVPTWALQTGGWTNPSSKTQYRNTANSLLTVSMGYKIFTSSGASGNVTNRQSATGYAGWKSIITFKETLPANAPSTLILLQGQ